MYPGGQPCRYVMPRRTRRSVYVHMSPRHGWRDHRLSAMARGVQCVMCYSVLEQATRATPPTICKLQSSSTSSSSGPPYGQCTASGACREPTFQPTGVLPEAQDRDWQRVQATQMCRLYMQQQSHSTPSLTLTHTLSTLLRTDLSGNGFSSRVVQRFIFIFFYFLPQIREYFPWLW